MAKKDQAMELSEMDRATIERLEEQLWREATRFDRKRMNEIFAPDFFEIGRSGRVWQREACLAIPRQPILAVLPLPELKVRLIQPDVAQVTYNSAVTFDGVIQYARRNSIWTRTAAGWQLRFHQGTPYETQT
jgi:hypothetical protein